MSKISEDDQFEVIAKYFTERGPVFHQFESYEYMVNVTLQKIVDECPSLKFENDTTKYRATFGQLYVEQSSTTDENNVVRSLFPQEARLRDLTYDCPISVDIKEEFWELNEETNQFVKSNELLHKKILLTRIPVMVRSSKCSLYSLTVQERVEQCECSNDTGGYFIINGKARALICQERLNYNQIYCFPNTDDKFPYVVEIRSMSDETGHSASVQVKSDSEGKGVLFFLPYMSKGVKAGTVFKALGYKNVDILKFLSVESKEELSLANRLVRESVPYTSKEKALKYISTASMKLDEDENRRVIYTRQVIENELFPHMGISTNIEKATILGNMINRLFKVVLGKRPHDDRDNVSVKRIENCGVLIADLFRMCLKRYCDNLKKYLEKRQDVITAISRSNNSITSSLKSAFCFPAGTLISLSNGLSCPIEKLESSGHSVLSWNGISIVPSVQTHFFNQGKKSTIKLTFEDGRILSCTPDHKILVIIDNTPTWVEAEKIVLDTRVLAGPEYPEDVIGNDENEWFFTVDDHIFNMTNTREKTLVFSRILGMLMSDKHKSGLNKGYVLLSSIENFISDCSFIGFALYHQYSRTSEGPTLHSNMKYKITLNRRLVNLIKKIKGINVNNPHCLPDFIFLPTCPVAVVREFIGGLFGGDGQSPFLEQSGCVAGVSFMWSDDEKNIDKLENTLKSLITLIKKIGVSGVSLNGPFISSNYYNPYPTANPFDYSIEFKPNTDFNKKIGFRYSTHKSFKLQIASSYWGMKENNSETDARLWIEQMGIIDLFDGGNEEQFYEKMPSYTIKLVNITQDCDQIVYDITVDKTHSFLANGIVSKNCTGNWTVQKNSYVRTGVSQIISNLSYPAMVSHLRRVVIPIGKEGKNVKIRQIDPTQVFYIDVIESPEGKSIGVVKNLAILSNITTGCNYVLVRDIIERCENLLPTSDYLLDSLHSYRVYLNGSLIGITTTPIDLYSELDDRHLSKVFSDQVSYIINDDDKEIRVYCDAGRFTVPVFTVGENNKLNFKKEHLSMTWLELLDENIIRYVDSNEMENSLTAIAIGELEKYNTNKYDYCHIHPSVMLGVCSSTIPYPETNQSPRLVYESSMLKQSIGMPNLAYQTRFETLSHVLHYPQKPLVSTKYNKMFKYDEMLTGCNPIVAVCAYGGFNQEDSTMINKSSVDRGMFVHTCFKSVSFEENKKTNCSFEKIEIPPKKVMLNGSDYSKLGPNGIVMKGCTVYKGDVLIGKTLTKVQKDEEDIISDCSLFVGKGEEGIVDAIWDGLNSENQRMIKIRIRQLRIPEVGDKAACFDSNTSILTEKGWKSISTVDVLDKVATLQNGILVYDFPINKFEYDHNGTMYRLESDQLDMMVTTNHNLYVKEKPEDNFIFVQADNIFGKHVIHKRNGKLRIPDSFHPNMKKSIYTLGVWCSKLERYNIPDFAWNLSEEEIRLFVKGLTTDYQVYHTKDLKMAEDLQRLYFHCGWSAIISGDHENYEIIPEFSECKDEQYTEEFVFFIGKVYCVEVPGNVVYVKRNGKPYWSGNSRSSQKGVFSLLMRQEDMPFTKDGIVPDIVMSALSYPSRMTMSQLLETLYGKVCSLSGKFGDATAFTRGTDNPVENIALQLKQFGFQKYGNERMYSGLTGEMLESEIFIGPTYYQRLKHLVEDKIHSRAKGNVTMLFGQPLGGKAVDGGLRAGEMERDCLISHGVSAAIQETFVRQSDKYEIVLCEKCGNICSLPSECRVCEQGKYTNINRVEIPYCCKLLFQELQSMGVKIQINTK